MRRSNGNIENKIKFFTPRNSSPIILPLVKNSSKEDIFKKKLKRIKTKINDKKNKSVNLKSPLKSVYNIKNSYKEKFNALKSNNSVVFYKNWSIDKYQNKLLGLAVINFSKESCDEFKRNNQKILDDLKSLKFARSKTRWKIFEEKICHFAPKCILKRLDYLNSPKPNKKISPIKHYEIPLETFHKRKIKKIQKKNELNYNE